jgi:hypothetical protein
MTTTVATHRRQGERQKASSKHVRKKNRSSRPPPRSASLLQQCRTIFSLGSLGYGRVFIMKCIGISDDSPLAVIAMKLLVMERVESCTSTCAPSFLLQPACCLSNERCTLLACLLAASRLSLSLRPEREHTVCVCWFVVRYQSLVRFQSAVSRRIKQSNHPIHYPLVLLRGELNSKQHCSFVSTTVLLVL